MRSFVTGLAIALVAASCDGGEHPSARDSDVPVDLAPDILQETIDLPPPPGSSALCASTRSTSAGCVLLARIKPQPSSKITRTPSMSPNRCQLFFEADNGIYRASRR